LFERGNKKAADPQAVIDNLHRKIGQLQVERDFLAGQPAIAPGSALSVAGQAKLLGVLLVSQTSGTSSSVSATAMSSSTECGSPSSSVGLCSGTSCVALYSATKASSTPLSRTLRGQGSLMCIDGIGAQQRPLIAPDLRQEVDEMIGFVGGS
jgi:hypothetical protein